MVLDANTLQGTYSAIVTPFVADGSTVDFDSLGNLIDFQLTAGVDGIVACGSTGEALTLTHQEYRDVMRYTVERVRGRVPCVAGIGSSSTKIASQNACLALESGMQAGLLVAPPYNKPSQAGILEHFRSVRSSCELPIIAYNVPGRAVANILPETVKQLSDQDLIIGLKDATGSLDQCMDTLALIGQSISYLSGEDALVYSIMNLGGKGTISASANLIPELMCQVTGGVLQGDLQNARAAQFEALPFVRAVFMETNPVPVKAGLKLKGVIENDTVRLPLIRADERTVQVFKGLLGL